MRRTIKVSDRIYGIVEYGSKVYGESIESFVERFADAFMSREDAKELMIRLEAEVNKRLSPVESEKKPLSPVLESVHTQLINDALSLIREFSSERAKELEERLAQIKSQMSPVE
jgi:hypothetical protein